VTVNVSNAQPSPNGLVAAYSFSEGTGVSTKDASGNNNTGTISAATWSTAGKFGNALSFNGTSAREVERQRRVKCGKEGDWGGCRRVFARQCGGDRCCDRGHVHASRLPVFSEMHSASA